MTPDKQRTIMTNRSAQNGIAEMDKMMDQSSRVLFRASTVFPFRLLPMRLTITEQTVYISEQTFLFSKSVTPILIKNLNHVGVAANFMMATLNFEVHSFEQSSIKVSHLWKDDAIKAGSIVNGLIMLHKEEIDMSGMGTEELVEKIQGMSFRNGG